MLKVMKFGGTSVGSVEAIKCVKSIIQKNIKEKHKPIVVCSAMSTITNKLLEAGKLAEAHNPDYQTIITQISNSHIEAIHQLTNFNQQSSTILKIKILLNELNDILHGIFLLGEFSQKSQDLILSFGEQLSCIIIADYLSQNKVNAKFIDARTLIKTNSQFTNAQVDYKTTNNNLKSFVNKLDFVPIITGFIASNAENETTTLGRGGSDYTASIIGAGVNADEIEIWTDVDGVMTADPRKVKTAYTINYLSYQEAMELSHFGAKIIYSPTIYPAFKNKIPLYIKNTFNANHPGTLITDSDKIKDNKSLIKGISSISDMAILNIDGSNTVGISGGILSKVTSLLNFNNINVILLTQASSEYSACLVLEANSAKLAEQILNKEFNQAIKAGMMDKLTAELGFSIISVVGENMKSHAGFAGKFFSACGKNGINIRAIAQGSSELNISAVIETNMLTKALNVVHEALFTDTDQIKINLFMTGVGFIGSTLINQIVQNSEYLLETQNIKINIVGLINTQKMLIKESGISPNKWKTLLNNGENASLENFVNRMKTMNLANTVFVDCTSSKKVTSFYPDILSNSIAITTPNKLANSGNYKDYQELHYLANKHNTKFLYETNVGAGLPIISTLKNLISSSDKILKIEGVLSGTLSYIFNSFVGNKKFSDIVFEGMKKGYTEPDPRSDLSGLDMARKILILARESGAELEMKDIKVTNILPKECIEAKTVEKFFIALEKNNDVFEKVKNEAKNTNSVLRMIAKYENNKAEVQLKMVNSSHPFYSLSGSDNIVAFTTKRYKERPLIVQGPGAGAVVTASGVFAEIISIAKFLRG
ncbi:MAG: bifunctional aspartate kinase/homoserine dehydrogenase I [Neisseriaceae bacterium]